MNNVPFIDLPPQESWGTKYDVLLRRFAETALVFYQAKGGLLSMHNVIGIESEWESIRFKAHLSFTRFLKKLYRCTLTVPHNITKWNAEDFIGTFNILSSKFGKPTIQRGMGIDDLRNHENYRALRPEELPHFEWRLGSCVVKHRFIDHWGIGPSTTIEPRG